MIWYYIDAYKKKFVEDKILIKVVLIDIDNTLLSFTGYVKESMREGFSYLEKSRWNLIFKELGIVFDGPTFEDYFKEKLLFI